MLSRDNRKSHNSPPPTEFALLICVDDQTLHFSAYDSPLEDHTGRVGRKSHNQSPKGSKIEALSGFQSIQVQAYKRNLIDMSKPAQYIKIKTTLKPFPVDNTV
jgi:hypothetical protein